MIGINVRRALLEQVEPHAGPVLSLYLDVDPANPDNVRKAFVLRAAEAMRGAGLNNGYIEKVTTKLSQEYVIPEGRSLVVFAGEDIDELFNAYYLQTRLPFLGLSDGALASWGKPLIAPLLFALDQKERYALIYVSSDRVRVFEAFLGQIQELEDYVREVDTEDWRRYRNARRSPAFGAGVAPRGGADVDKFRARMEEATARHYRSLLPEVEAVVNAEGVDRIILIGLPSAVAEFQGVLSKAMENRVVGSVSPPSDPDAPPHEWLPLVSDLMASAEAEHEKTLLDRIAESGVRGVQDTLTVLQEHRVHTLVVPWTLDLAVYRAEGGRVSAGLAEAQALSPDEEVEEVTLLEVLPDLVTGSGAVLEFVTGDNEDRLRAEFGGLAGITRW